MKLLTIAPLLLSTLVASKSLSFFGKEQSVVGESLSVPGKSPLEYCQPTHDDDILVIEHVNLKPNPPLAGSILTIEAVGKVLDDIEEKAYVNLQVKYGLITLIKTTMDLCDQVKNVDLSCPIQKGKITLTKDVELPSEIPNGKYTVLADVYTFDDRHITCLTAQVTFQK